MAKKIYMDTEFIETRGKVQLVSIGLVAESGERFYAELNDYHPYDADKWVKEQVLSKLLFDGKYTIDEIKKKLGDGVRTAHADKDAVCSSLKAWLEQIGISKDNRVEMWGYYSDYDWVAFCSLFGRMIDLPTDILPMYCLDLKQSMDAAGLTKEWKQLNCPDPEEEHNALADALWNVKLDYAIQQHLNKMKML